MPDAVQFESPENVRIAYTPAGLGTRFMAWTIDQIFVSLVLLVLFVVLLVVAVAVEPVGDLLGEILDGVDETGGDDIDPTQLALFVIGILFLAYGLGSFVYFGLTELLMRGQTYGKRSAKIRVVKSDGFSLDGPSIFLRNLFRIADQLPPLWAVPVFSPRSQRFGDMVSGTLVVADGDAELSPLRAALADRTASDARYRFDATALRKIRPSDTAAIEKLLERWAGLDAGVRRSMLTAIVGPMAARIEVDPPPTDSTSQQKRFLEDLLAAEYRRRNRNL